MLPLFLAKPLTLRIKKGPWTHPGHEGRLINFPASSHCQQQWKRSFVQHPLCVLCHHDLTPTLSRHSYPHFQAMKGRIIVTEPQIIFFHTRLPSLGFLSRIWQTIWESGFQWAMSWLNTQDVLKNDQSVLLKETVSGSGHLSHFYLPTLSLQSKYDIHLGRIICSWELFAFSKEDDHVKKILQENLESE